MAGRIRGQEATLQILVEGEPLAGSWIRVNDFELSPRQELTDEDYIGEDVSKIDFQHNGFDFSFSVNIEDSATITFLQDLVIGEENHLPYPNITLNVIYTFRNGGSQVMESYYETYLKVNSQSVGGRTEFVSVSVEGKSERRNVLALG